MTFVHTILLRGVVNDDIRSYNSFERRSQRSQSSIQIPRGGVNDGIHSIIHPWILDYVSHFS